MTFHCRRCGNCCRGAGFVRLSAAEITAISVYLGLDELRFIEQFTRLAPDRGALALIDQPDESCIFLEEREGAPTCRIEPVKPRQCRDFPLVWNFPGWERVCAAGKDEQKKS